jgi:quinoprotein glucose dehydrogenase
MKSNRKFSPLVLCPVLLLLASRGLGQHSQPLDEWPVYGGNLAGQHHSTLRQINSATIQRLRVAWSFHTGALTSQGGAANARASFEANPVFWNKTLFFDTPFDEIFALDGATGRRIWSFNPKVDRNQTIHIVTSRGVALWHGNSRNRESCARDRVFVATLDRRLIAVDAQSGALCEQFGNRGTVDLTAGLHLKNPAQYEFTSPPTVVGNAVILGSSSGDNQAIEVPTGAVRAFDAVSGRLLWSWEPLPWARDSHPRTGSGGAWSVISADIEQGLIFVPTGSPSLDFYGVKRPGDNRDANSVVALEAASGKRVWGFQVVHHDLWDYDVAAEPLLFTFQGKTPAVAITTKMGMVFVLNRLTGEPLFPVYERAVPPSVIPGEKTSATQPFSSLPPLAPLTMAADSVGGETEADRKFCRDKLAGLVNKGIYTPVELAPTLLYPGSLGGVNWGSAAFDPATATMYVNVNRMAYDVRLLPREPSPSAYLFELGLRLDWYREHHGDPATRLLPGQLFRPPDGGGRELNRQDGAPYLLFREPLTTPGGLPCNPQPWGELVAFNLNSGRKEWSRPLGTMIAGKETGSVSLGGPISAADLIFSAATVEPLLRAYNKKDGAEVWRAALPAPAQATPMTYQMDGKQYLVICAGGSRAIGTRQGDAVVAFSF